MNFNDYFAGRGELAMRMLVEVPEPGETRADWRLVAVGALCLATALGAQIWASYVLVDPGYFVRMSRFLEFVLLAGTSVLAVSAGVAMWSTRHRITVREALKERTVARLISADRAIARKLADDKA